MSRRSWHRAVAALLVVAACSMILPARGDATSMTMDSAYTPVGKIWNKALDWLLSLWKPSTGTGRRIPGVDKFGAGQSSVGHTSSRTTY